MMRVARMRAVADGLRKESETTYHEHEATHHERVQAAPRSTDLYAASVNTRTPQRPVGPLICRVGFRPSIAPADSRMCRNQYNGRESSLLTLASRNPGKRVVCERYRFGDGPPARH